MTRLRNIVAEQRTCVVERTWLWQFYSGDGDVLYKTAGGCRVLDAGETCAVIRCLVGTDACLRTDERRVCVLRRGERTAVACSAIYWCDHGHREGMEWLRKGNKANRRECVKRGQWPWNVTWAVYLETAPASAANQPRTRAKP